MKEVNLLALLLLNLDNITIFLIVLNEKCVCKIMKIS